jgi:4-hydroxybenzoate polyprenyltransferase
LKRVIAKVFAFLSWRQWGVLRYNSIWQNLGALFYIALVSEHFHLQFIGEVLLFVVFSTIMTGFGYLVNDLADQDLDFLQGKRNAFSGVTKKKAALVVAAALIIGSLFGLPFISRPWFGLLWVLWIAAAFSYSLPPLRLKERGWAGLVVTIAAQQTLPTAMLFAAFGSLFSWGTAVFMIFATARGISSDVSHQLRDRAIDAASGARTFAVQQGKALGERIYAFSLEIERAALGAVLLLLLVELPALRLFVLEIDVPIALPLTLFYLPLFILTAGSSLRALSQGRLMDEDPYNEARQSQRRDALHVIHHTLPTVVLPLYLGAWLSFLFWPYLIFLVIISLLYGLYSPGRWAATWPLRPILSFFKTARN